MIHLFVDGSVNTVTKEGFGAFFYIEDLDQPPKTEEIILTHFENTSSTKLELENLLVALGTLDVDQKVSVYTDSQNIIQLPSRREKLIAKEFKNSRGIELKNHHLYKEFFKLISALDIHFIKIKGHQPKGKKNQLDLLFSIVDKASRKALRGN